MVGATQICTNAVIKAIESGGIVFWVLGIIGGWVIGLLARTVINKLRNN